ncbi:hypothetical protein HMPREF0179_05290 [Bilophila wadsworthia 3_1_6]|uniref:Uncharacterized protein n=1 Tax=Bilophila wadsworthia (strain 3_1_6) TaxID=563192 RepID=S2KTB0_BILW3|nr:hypothetical protein HMPREF0179_05290 [Bilophila wadsworthia 3_1_6]
MGEAMITRWRENRLGGRGSATCRGRGTFLKKGSPPPAPPLPKTFDWWGGGAEGVRSSNNLKKFLYAV